MSRSVTSESEEGSNHQARKLGMEKKLIELEIEDLEERIAPGVLANPAATPGGGMSQKLLK